MSLFRSHYLRWIIPVIAGLSGFGFSASFAQDATTDEAVVEEGAALTQDSAANDEIDPGFSDLAFMREALKSHLARGQPEPALQVALEMAAAMETTGDSAHELVEPFAKIADLQLEAGDTKAAEQTFGRLIGLIEATDGVFSADLVDPLAALAQLHANTGRRAEAVTLLRRARHITHRQLGILNLEQVEIVDQLADNYFRLGQISDGSRESRFAYRVNLNEYGEDSAEIVPATNSLAAWYERIGEYTVARRYYKRSLELIEKDYGENDLRMVETLQRIAGTYRRQGIYKSEGQNALIRAVNIQASHPEADQVSRANSLTELADWQLATLRTRDAMKTYKQVWNLLTADGANPARGNDFFREPKRLRYEPPIPTANRLISLPEVHVDVELIVTAEGTPREIKIIESTADWRTQAEVKSAMRSARFRPRFVDGEPVPTRISTRWTYVVPEHMRRQSEVSAGAN